MEGGKSLVLKINSGIVNYLKHGGRKVFFPPTLIYKIMIVDKKKLNVFENS